MNAISSRLAAPIDSPEHNELRWDLCNGRLLGDYGATRYFVSILTGKDQFAISANDFHASTQDLARSILGDTADRFFFDGSSVALMRPLFDQEYRKRFNGLGLEHKWIKADEAIICLLQNPGFSHLQISEIVPTTEKQLARFCSYNYLRRSIK